MNYFFRLIAISFLLLGLNISLTAQNAGYWNDIPQYNIQTSGERIIKPLIFRTLTLNVAEIKNILLTAPPESITLAKYSNVIISLPLPDGSYSRFRIVDSPVMEKELADKFPDIKTYAGQGIDDPYSNVRFDLTPAGFHAIIFNATDIVFIDPYAMSDNYNYISYYKKDFRKDADNFTCEVIDNDFKNTDKTPLRFENRTQGQLRTYRIAIAATGEYTTFHGGTVVAGLAAVVTSLNRVDGVYENEVAVRMVLVGNNNLIIYTNASTDPYTNNNGSTMLGQNQTNLDNVIGTANYDIGHIFSTGGGGVAYLGCVCVASSKAKGVTGSSQPIGDPFDIDYVAHEMGHQFGGNHTFNCTSGSCGGGNRVASAAYEPGSGSTIMAYAGICGAGDLQPHSDAYFHSKSLDEIINFTTGGSGNTCAQITATGNLNPVVTLGAGGNTIPISTPFSLTGSATDGNGDSIKYCWEEYDLGPAGLPNAPSGNAPIFRSFTPVTSGTRTFPKLANLLNNTQTIGELLPTYTRSLTFCLTARDNRAGGGGVGFDYITFDVSATAGPFLVTFPNTAVTLNANTPQTVTWNVANTNTAPVSCANVNILLSTDGGQTFPTVLKTNTPNDGSETVNLPVVANSTARIKVAAVDNIFFDISNTNFTISTVSGISENQTEPYSFKLLQNYPNPFNPATMINFTIPKMGTVTLKVYDIKGELVASLINNELRTEGNYSVQFDGSSFASGMYFYRLESGSFVETRRMVLIK
ncbi:MAG TPA: zinc-dependent metalloprotease family protein [Ignavibacteria bacterium]